MILWYGRVQFRFLLRTYKGGVPRTAISTHVIKYIGTRWEQIHLLSLFSPICSSQHEWQQQQIDFFPNFGVLKADGRAPCEIICKWFGVQALQVRGWKFSGTRCTTQLWHTGADIASNPRFCLIIKHSDIEQGSCGTRCTTQLWHTEYICSSQFKVLFWQIILLSRSS